MAVSDNAASVSTTRIDQGVPLAYGPVPWHMAGRTLAIWYKLRDPAEARRHVPAELEMDEDPVVRARFWDMIHDAGLGDGAPVLNPEQTRFREAVVAFPVRHGHHSGDFPTYMYADDPVYIAFGREVMGWQLRYGRLHMNQPWPAAGLAPGTQLSGYLERHGRGVMEARLRLVRQKEERPGSALPRWLTLKRIPRADGPGLALHQLVATGPERFSRRLAWEAEAELRFGSAPNDELQLLEPREVVAAEYWVDVDLSIGYGEIIEEWAQ